MAQSSRWAIWKGTAREEEELVAAIERHCVCGALDDAEVDVCAAHQLLGDSQTTLDRLLFARRIADRLRREEGLTGADRDQ
jgi:hypothetical protein